MESESSKNTNFRQSFNDETDYLLSELNGKKLRKSVQQLEGGKNVVFESFDDLIAENTFK